MKIKNIFYLFFLLFLTVFSCTSENDLEDDSENISRKKPSVPARTPKREYTKEEPGEWKQLEKDHLPIIKIDTSIRKNNVHIIIPGKFNENHYIERIGIMDEDLKDITGVDLSKNQKMEIDLSLYPIPDNPNTKVYVKCNKHDLWTEPIIKK